MSTAALSHADTHGQELNNVAEPDDNDVCLESRALVDAVIAINRDTDSNLVGAAFNGLFAWQEIIQTGLKQGKIKLQNH